MMDILSISAKPALRWMPENLTDEMQTLVQVKVRCHQTTSHYLNQCWPVSMAYCQSSMYPIFLYARLPQFCIIQLWKKLWLKKISVHLHMKDVSFQWQCFTGTPLFGFFVNTEGVVRNLCFPRCGKRNVEITGRVKGEAIIFSSEIKSIFIQTSIAHISYVMILQCLIQHWNWKTLQC